MQFIDLPPLHHAQGNVRLPGSKSISNRMLLLAALAEGSTQLYGLLESDDVMRMREALLKLGVDCRDLGKQTWQINGCAGKFPIKQADLFLGNAGTAFRSLTAVLALSEGSYTLTGIPRMHERPIGDLVDALQMAGAHIDYLEQAGYPPLRIHPSIQDAHNALVKVKGNVSSQFLTGLLMALPLQNRNIVLEVEGELISKPYVEITLNLMQRFGVNVKREGFARFHFSAGMRYRSPGLLHVEGDASSASYFLAAGALGGGPVTVHGVGSESIQGDVAFAQALQSVGAQVTLNADSIAVFASPNSKLRAFDLDLNHIPDAAMTLAIVALFTDGPCRLRNIASWRVKETDRIAAMATELRKVGAQVEEGLDYLAVTPPTHFTPNASIDTYDDHRMAMCFSLVALGGVPIRINDPNCVAKTFPDYFTVFKSVTA